jgi:hypothetical protein
MESKVAVVGRDFVKRPTRPDRDRYRYLNTVLLNLTTARIFQETSETHPCYRMLSTPQTFAPHNPLPVNNAVSETMPSNRQASFFA